MRSRACCCRLLLPPAAEATRAPAGMPLRCKGRYLRNQSGAKAATCATAHCERRVRSRVCCHRRLLSPAVAACCRRRACACHRLYSSHSCAKAAGRRQAHGRRQQQAAAACYPRHGSRRSMLPLPQHATSATAHRVRLKPPSAACRPRPRERRPPHMRHVWRACRHGARPPPRSALRARRHAAQRDTVCRRIVRGGVTA